MLLVGSGIDAMVATFGQVGVFKPKEVVDAQANTGTTIVVDFLNDIVEK